MSDFRRGRGRGGIATRPRPVAPTGAAATSRDFEDEGEEADEIKDLREKYSSKLSTAKELFPDWADEDLLFTIQEALGDLDLAIVRITDGQAEQWGAVKAKKTKKDTPAVSAAPAVFNGPGRGGFGDRGGRGRGALAAGRGGRGVARGARGGGAVAPSATPRAPYANGSSNGTTPASFTAPAPVAAAPTWVTPTAPVSSTPAPTGWGDVAAASTTTAAAATSEWGAATETSTTATQGWGDEQPAKQNGDAPHDAPVTDGWAAPKSKPASKIIAPGAKMSWAQIARPVSPPKPTPPPPAPVAAPAPPPVVASIPTPPAPAPAPVVEQAPEPVAAPEPVQTAPAASWNEAPSPGPLDAWASAPSANTPAPLGVGEGWADTVVAAPEPEAAYAHQVLPEVEAHLPPNDIATAGPIEVTSSSAPAVEESMQTIPVAPEPPVAEQQEKLFGAGPPGLGGKRASNRPQHEAVVMPSERAAAGLDIGVQFGSLSLFETQPAFQKQDAAVQVAKPEPSFVQPQEAPAQAPQYSQEAAHHYQLAQQAQAQQQQQHHSLQDQSFAPPPNSFAQNNAFANRYPSSQYGQPQAPAEEQGATSAYAPFKPDAAPSPYFQHPSHSPAPSQQQQQQQGVPTSYASSYGLSQNAPGQPAAFGAGQGDYSAAYQQDSAMRNMGFYDQYGQQQQQQQSSAFQQQTASPLPRQDDPATAASSSPAPVTPQPGQPGQGQPGYYQPQNYYQPYPQYYQPQHYNQQAYPPNFNALQAQYAQQPYGGQYGYQQQARPGPAGVPGQQQYGAPTHSQQGSQSFRGQAPGGQGQGQPAQAPQAAQAYNNGYGGGYPAAAAAYDPRTAQGQEDPYSSSKDLDRGFY